MADRPRGRANARGQDPRRRQQDAPGQGDRQQHHQQPQGAWARRPGPPPTEPGPSQSTPYSRPQQSHQSRARPVVKRVNKSGGQGYERAGGSGDASGGYSGGRGAEPVEPPKGGAPVGGRGGGGDVAAGGRGSMRGRRIISSECLSTRPQNLEKKTGDTGNRVMMQANFFRVLATPDWCIYQYRVDFSPDEERTQVRKGMLRLHKEKLGNYIFDGTVLYSGTKFPENFEFHSKRQSDDVNVKITFRLVGDLMKGDHHYIQFFNIIMRKCLDMLNLQLVGRDYYDPRSKQEVRDFRLELWPGYLTSIRQHEREILMCAEVSHKVMRQETLLDILNNIYNNSRGNWQAEYCQQVRGIIVLTDYNNNTYRVEDVTFEVTPTSTFKMKNGQDVSYKDYYQTKYQIRIRNEKQPMLLTKKRSMDRRAGEEDYVYLVPELCRATGITDQMRSNFQLMKAIAQFTKLPPMGRMEKLMTFNRRLRGEPKVVEELKSWNLKLDEKLIEIPARVLQPEKIVLGGGRIVSAEATADWTRSLFNKPAYKTTKLSNWVVVCTGHAKSNVQQFVRMLSQSAEGMGCRIEEPRYYDLRDDRAGSYTDALETIMSKASPELIFCVVSNNQASRYSAIKKKCTVDRPVPTQVFTQRNLTNKGVRSIATKVAIQLNCKLGGAPWSVELPNINLMVIGFDVCHDTEQKSCDFGAMVASLDKGLSRYFSAVSAHKSGEELSNEFSVNVIKAIQTYRNINKTLPSHILVYRDGVGEGQVPHVVSHEVEELKTKLRGLYGEQPVKMAFILVTKRINTRFFRGRDNPPPGTIIDDVVTNPLKYDFFIVSQTVREGTVAPTSYSVIADTIGWSPDQIQRITYKLTHMYYNWSGGVRVPAPCQYAHKLAFLVSQSIHRPPSTQLETLLYFL